MRTGVEATHVADYLRGRGWMTRASVVPTELYSKNVDDRTVWLVEEIKDKLERFGGSVFIQAK